jgi:hypothetical protein
MLIYTFFTFHLAVTKNCGWWRKTTYIFEFSVKSAIRIRYFSSWDKKSEILLTGVIIQFIRYVWLCGSYMFRHYILMLRERSWSLLRDVFNWGAVDKMLWMGVLCLVSWCVVITTHHDTIPYIRWTETKNLLPSQNIYNVNDEIMMKERPTKCIFKVNHAYRISILHLHVSALQERHFQGAQRILKKLCVCYIISVE